MSCFGQDHLFTFEDFYAEGDDNHRILMVLDALDDRLPLAKLEWERNGRRDHYPVRVQTLKKARCSVARTDAWGRSNT